MIQFTDRRAASGYPKARNLPGKKVKTQNPPSPGGPPPSGDSLFRHLILALFLGLWWAPPAPAQTLPEAAQAVRVKVDEATYRSGPDPAYDRYGPLPRGLVAQVIGRQGDWIRIHPGGGWVEAADLEFLPPGAPLSQPVLRGASLAESPEGAAEVRLRLDDLAPWQVETAPYQRRLTLRLPGARMAMGEVSYPPRPERIRLLRLKPSAEGLDLELDLGDEGLWGYRLEWRPPDLVLALAPPPRRGWSNPPRPGPAGELPSPLQGVRVVVDAGHGGADLGAVGVGGLREKDLNLRVAGALRKELEAAGAQVVMTRTEDREVASDEAPASVELGQRVRLAERAGGQLFLSVHHNARPTLDEARRAHGTDIYYYHPESAPLAEALAEPIARSTGEPDHRILWRSFFVIRQTGMLSVLLELNYLSNPQIERDILAQEEYPGKVSEAIRTGLETFLRRAGKNH